MLNLPVYGLAILPIIGHLGAPVFLAAGLIVAAMLFFVFPRAIKVLGVTTYQRLGCLVGIPAFIAIPNARSLSRNDTGVFWVSVACTVLIYCCQAMVSPGPL